MLKPKRLVIEDPVKECKIGPAESITSFRAGMELGMGMPELGGHSLGTNTVHTIGTCVFLCKT